MADGLWLMADSHIHPPICHSPSAISHPPLTLPRPPGTMPAMTVKLVYSGKEYEVPAGMTVRDALKKVGLQPETTLAVKDGKLMTDDTILVEGAQVKLIAVISGGSTPTPAIPHRVDDRWVHWGAKRAMGEENGGGP